MRGAGSVTILTVTTMPGNDVTHPVPDNTGYITEGQFYLHDGVIDPFGSLSRLKQQVIGKVTREDHSQVMNTMIRLYSGATEAEKKQAMAFDLSPFDHKLLKFGSLFLHTATHNELVPLFECQRFAVALERPAVRLARVHSDEVKRLLPAAVLGCRFKSKFFHALCKVGTRPRK